MYKSFTLFAPSYCVSAGTLIALGASTLIMDAFSELGPLDVQLLKRDEIGTRKSGLISKSTFESLAEASFELFENIMLSLKLKSSDLINFKLASEIGAQIASSVMSPIYAKIEPDIIGGDYRDQQIAMEYGIRLVRYGQNANISSVYRLVHTYPAHDFIIDDDEANTLFDDVQSPPDALYDLIATLGPSVYNEAKTPYAVAFPGPPPSDDHADKTEEKNDNATKPNDNDAADGVDEDRRDDRPSDPESAKRPSGTEASSANSPPEKASDTGE